MATPAAGVIWKLEEGDIVRTKVYGSPDLSADAMVNANGTAFFPAIGRVRVMGLSLDSVEALLNQRYASQVIRNAAVQVTMLRDVTLFGQVRSPGVYATDPGMTILGLVARAGGQSSPNSSNTPDVTLEMAGGKRLQLPREARLGSIDLHRVDAIYLGEQSFFVRNQNAIAATQLIASLLSVILTVATFATR